MTAIWAPQGGATSIIFPSSRAQARDLAYTHRSHKLTCVINNGFVRSLTVCAVRDDERRGQTFPPNNFFARSSHFGFSLRTSSFFFSRRQPLISFSRVIADIA